MASNRGTDKLLVSSEGVEGWRSKAATTGRAVQSPLLGTIARKTGTSPALVFYTRGSVACYYAEKG